VPPPILEATTITLRDGRSLAYAEYGDPAGAPALYFHGTPGCRLEGAYFYGASKESRVRLIAVDRPGYGRSDYFHGREIDQWPDDVEQLISSLGLRRVGIVGLSGGAPHAIACAARIPHRITVACLISSATPPDARLDGARNWLRPVYRAGFAGFAFVAPAIAKIVAWWLPRMPSPGSRSLRIERRKREWAEAFRGGSRGLAQELLLHVRPWGIEMSDIDVPMHIWHGESDRLAPIATARWLAQRLPHAQVHWQPGAGHDLYLACADDVTSVIEKAAV
jgi:pimeloyl-ACP methyl ester carboxylesterase